MALRRKPLSRTMAVLRSLTRVDLSDELRSDQPLRNHSSPCSWISRISPSALATANMAAFRSTSCSSGYSREAVSSSSVLTAIGLDTTSYMKEFHANGFEMVDIPQSSVSGKNSADIRMVVDAIDLCYSKTHIDTFALLTGDSDFSPLASKLKENDKRVVGCGVRSSTSDLLANNCDEFIFYDDLAQGVESEPHRSGRKVRRRSSRRRSSVSRRP